MARKETRLGRLMRALWEHPKASSTERCAALFPVARALWEHDNALQQKLIAEARAREAVLMEERGEIARNSAPDSARLRAMVFTKH